MRIFLFVACWMLPISLCAQSAAPSTELSPGLSRRTAVDAASGIEYALISMEGKLVGPVGSAASTAPVPPPQLTAQCTKDKAGKLKFELRADLGGVTDMAFYAPWKQTADDPYPPVVEKVTVTMDFLGYMKVKPVKRQWVRLKEMHDELKYATPGLSSGNMEEIRFYLQFLKALPTLRLTVPGPSGGIAEFESTKWQAALKKEPLCAAAGL